MTTMIVEKKRSGQVDVTHTHANSEKQNTKKLQT